MNTDVQELLTAGMRFMNQMSDLVGGIPDFYQEAMQSDIDGFKEVLSGMQQKHNETDELARLRKLLEDNRYDAAEQNWLDADLCEMGIGKGKVFKECDGWEYITGSNKMRRVFYYEDEEYVDNTPSSKAWYYVHFVPDSAEIDFAEII